MGKTVCFDGGVHVEEYGSGHYLWLGNSFIKRECRGLGGYGEKNAV